MLKIFLIILKIIFNVVLIGKIILKKHANIEKKKNNSKFIQWKYMFGSWFNFRLIKSLSRSIEIIESGGYLLQLRQSDSKKLWQI